MLKRDLDQLWAEAAAREASGASIRLPERLWLAATQEQQQRQLENPFLSVLDRALRDTNDPIEEDGEQVGRPMQGKISVEGVWALVGLRDHPGRRTQKHIELVGAAMRELGWERDRQRVGGQLKYCYIKGPQPYRLIEVEPYGGCEGVPLEMIASYMDVRPPNSRIF